MRVKIIGGGLAGSEAALQLAKADIDVDLYEMRPNVETHAHKTEKLAEFVCSNSLGSLDITNASGLLKKEMQMLGGFLIEEAIKAQVPSGGALGIDRVAFSDNVTKLIEENPKINIIFSTTKSFGLEVVVNNKESKCNNMIIKNTMASGFAVVFLIFTLNL